MAAFDRHGVPVLSARALAAAARGPFVSLLALAFALGLGVSLGGCASSHGNLYSESRHYVAPPHVYSVRIVGIDGDGKFRHVAKVEPGRHQVTVISLGPNQRYGQTKPITLSLHVEPCHDYYIVARHAGPGSAEWAPEVETVEKRPDCG